MLWAVARVGAIGTSLLDVRRSKRLVEEGMEPEPVPPDERDFASHRPSPRVPRSDIYAGDGEEHECGRSSKAR
jgi:hypothetical protein